MLKRITINNFQSHKKTELELHEGVNVLIGNSDCGKSAVLRAVSWAILNKCDDSSFIRKGETSASVSLEFDTHTVTRSRDNSGNQYEFSKGKKKEVFKAFKQTIPEDVADFLNMTEINVQTQLEAPFLLSQTAGDVAKSLNKMVDLSIIHESVSGIKKRVLQNSRNIENIIQQIEENKTEIEKFKFLAGFEKKVKKFEALEKERVTLETGICDLAKSISRYQDRLDKIDEFDEFLEMEKLVNKASKASEEIKEYSEQIRTIAKLLATITKSKEQYESLKTLIVIEPKVSETIELVKTIAKLADSIAIGNRYETALVKLEDRIGYIETEYIDNMPEVCPLCEREMLPVEK